MVLQQVLAQTVLLLKCVLVLQNADMLHVRTFYRLGWNPQSSDQDVRTGTLLNAVYRAIQDAKTSVRFLRENFSVGGNTYKVDTSKVIVGGQGSGGYVAFAYASLDKVSELNLQSLLTVLPSSLMLHKHLPEILAVPIPLS